MWGNAEIENVISLYEELTVPWDMQSLIYRNRNEEAKLMAKTRTIEILMKFQENCINSEA